MVCPRGIVPPAALLEGDGHSSTRSKKTARSGEQGFQYGLGNLDVLHGHAGQVGDGNLAV